MNINITMLTLAFVTVSQAASGPAARVKDLDWMAGSWTGSHHGSAMEAHYTTAQGDLILGMTKMQGAQGLEFFEFEQIREDQGRLVLRPYPYGNPGVEFQLKENTTTSFTFENPAHDFPTRIIYELRSSGELAARIEGTQNGQPVSDEFVFSKMK